MSNTLVRDAVLTCLIFSGGFYAYMNRDSIYERAGFAPQDIAAVRAHAKAQRQTSTTEIKNAEAVTRYATPRSAIIAKSDDGQFWAQGRINNSSVKFLVDTGASVVVLTPSDARKSGIHPDSLEYTTPVNTAAGQIKAAKTIITSISIGKVTVYNVQAVVIPKGLTHSLLGMSFLGELRKLEVTPEELVLHQ
ncbi:MAG: TIGR02281 family clan AA aspartic protease [Robiginitomaculum sp.]|nr:MAG: TIGR02281 family clan AA aspartic protease [Robiginitomaculum sp.]